MSTSSLARSAMTGMFAAALLALAGLSGCAPRAPEAAPPPAPATQPPPSPELMGGPPSPPSASEPPTPAPDAAMAPIANPEDMSREERARIYGHRYDYLDRPAAEAPRRRHRIHGEVGRQAEAGGPYRPARHHHHRRGAGGARVDHEQWSTRRGHHHHHHLGQALARGAPGAASGLHAASPGAKTAPASAAPAASPPPATATPTNSGASAQGFNLDWLSLPGAPYVKLLGFGRVASKYVVGACLLIIALALLAFAAHRNRQAQATRRPARNTVGAGPAFADEKPREPPAP